MHGPGDLSRSVGSDGQRDQAEWSEDEVYVSLPRPGGDAWMTIDLACGEVTHELTDRGWISYFNDLHKGRNTGAAWSLFIDVFAFAALIFAVSSGRGAPSWSGGGGFAAAIGARVAHPVNAAAAPTYAANPSTSLRVNSE